MADLDERDLWLSVEHTVRNVLLPVIDDEWAKAAAVQLVGLARYCANRPPDATAARGQRIADALDSLLDDPLVAGEWNGDRSSTTHIYAVAGAVLAAATGVDDDQAEGIEQLLRPLIVGQLDDELAVTSALVTAFRGQLDA